MPTINQEIRKQEALLQKMTSTIEKEDEEKIKKSQVYLENLQKIKMYLGNRFESINELNENGTPLIYAIRNQDWEMFELLLSHPKIDVNKGNYYNRTPVWWSVTAKPKPKPATVSSPAPAPITYLEKLVEKGADLNIADSKGKSPFLSSLKNKFFEASAFIIFKLTDFSLYQDSDYRMHPIHKLCEANYDEKTSVALLEFFKNNNVDLNARNKNNQTPLMIAAKARNLVVINWLIKNGADITALDRNNQTFLEYVPKNSIQEVNEVLAKHNLNKDWYEDVNKVKEFGHALGIGTFLKLGHSIGLGGIVPVPLSDTKTVPIYTESWEKEEAFKFLVEELEKYSTADPANENFAILHKAAKTTNQYLSSDIIKFSEKLYKSYAKGNPVLIPLTVPGHGLGLALYKNKLIYTDRSLASSGTLTECTKIFDLKNVDEKELKSLMHDNFDSVKQIVEKLKTIVDYDNPVLRTGDKFQAHGTCMYVNPRSNCEGILCVLQAEKEAKSLQGAKASAHQSYRKFLYWQKEQKIAELVGYMQQADKNGNAARANMYYKIAEGYMRGHRSRTKNDGTDWKNCLELYNGFSPSQQEQFQKNNKSISRKIKYHKAKSLAPITITRSYDGAWVGAKPQQFAKDHASLSQLLKDVNVENLYELTRSQSSAQKYVAFSESVALHTVSFNRKNDKKIKQQIKEIQELVNVVNGSLSSDDKQHAIQQLYYALHFRKSTLYNEKPPSALFKVCDGLMQAIKSKVPDVSGSPQANALDSLGENAIKSTTAFKENKESKEKAKELDKVKSTVGMKNTPYTP